VQEDVQVGSTANFFEESREQSVVKAEIVEKYFNTWAKIIAGAQNRHRPNADNRIGYVDLFAGPGRYKDGAMSTPLRVLEKVIADPVLAERFVSVFNDKNPEHASTLQDAIDNLPGIEKLKNKPQIWNQEVGDEIAKSVASINTIPVLAFIDPWGYKGLTLKLVDAFLKDWGCDCIFFFNYSRINAGLSNPKVHQHMCALFGEQRAGELQSVLEPMSPAQREATIVDALAMSLKAFGHRYVLPFCFKKGGARTTHHLILVTKHFKGYEVMKDIMAKSSSSHEQGVPSFAYATAASQQGLLFALNRPLDDLRVMLLQDLAGQRLTTRQIYERHSVDRPYILKNYKDVLSELENTGAIKTQNRRSKRGFADDIIVEFPPRS
jgi:three-Cys-motif partner protein